MNDNILVELVKARSEANKEYSEMYKKMIPYWDKYCASVDAVIKEFVEQKLYIPIDKLPEYLDDKEISQITVVFENKETKHLYHPYNIYYNTKKYKIGGYVPARMLESNVGDDGYYFEYDIDEDHIIGFYDLELADGIKIKETYMEEIIRKVLNGTK